MQFGGLQVTKFDLITCHGVDAFEHLVIFSWHQIPVLRVLVQAVTFVGMWHQNLHLLNGPCLIHARLVPDIEQDITELCTALHLCLSIQLKNITEF